jgi:hypothetical protein
MWRLHSALHPDTTRLTVSRTGPAVAQLRGLGGIGKTLLAEEYALRCGAAYPGGVYWLRAYGSHETSGQPSLTSWPPATTARSAPSPPGLGLAVADRSPDEVLGALAAKLAKSDEPCLWVVDDLPDGLQAPQVQALLAPHPVACTLLTTRSRRYDDLAATIDLDVLPAEDALTPADPPPPGPQRPGAHRRSGLGGRAWLPRPGGRRGRRGAAHPNWLGSFAEFRGALKAPSQDELELAGELAKALPGGHEASIAATLQRRLRRLDAPGSDVLRLAAVVAAAPLPLAIVAAVLGHGDGLDEQAARRQATRGVSQAEALSLASPTGLGADPDDAGDPTTEGAGWSTR